MTPELQFAYLMTALWLSFPVSVYAVYALHKWLCEAF
jgi:hypothetical protein